MSQVEFRCLSEPETQRCDRPRRAVHKLYHIERLGPPTIAPARFVRLRAAPRTLLSLDVTYCKQHRVPCDSCGAMLVCKAGAHDEYRRGCLTKEQSNEASTYCCGGCGAFHYFRRPRLCTEQWRRSI